jgi:hypothetical protein
MKKKENNNIRLQNRLYQLFTDCDIFGAITTFLQVLEQQIGIENTTIPSG